MAEGRSNMVYVHECNYIFYFLNLEAKNKEPLQVNNTIFIIVSSLVLLYSGRMLCNKWMMFFFFKVWRTRTSLMYLSDINKSVAENYKKNLFPSNFVYLIMIPYSYFKHSFFIMLACTKFIMAYNKVTDCLLRIWFNLGY